ncbi:MAG TPA: hypothetical protein VF179_23535 [Thermoanaerobaculia bacterium]|nr:hypothetical protein [Thermoanaerobaculia bacterium]
MTEGIFSNSYSTMWTAFGAIAQGVASIFAIAALIYSMTTFRKSLMLSHYGELDRMYFDILNIVMAHPEFANPKSLENGRDKAQYDAYAFMVWNFLETIYDRCGETQHLRLTWCPVMEYEASLHRDWLDRPENARKFKQKFLQFVHGGLKQW